MSGKQLTKDMITQFDRKIIDGGWGTEMQKRGGEPGECFEAWNLSHPEKVLAVAQSYVDSGSDIILTNSFGGNGIILDRHGHAKEVEAINKAAASISREAAGENVYVFGSMGPCGRLVNMGELDENLLRDTFAQQAKALEAGGADAIVIETMIDITEVEILLQVLRREVQIPFGACMTFDSGPEKMHTMMGVTPANLIETATAAGAAFVGANCGNGIEDYLPIASVFGEKSPLPVWIKPNAGLPKIVNGEIVYDMDAEKFASFATKFFDAGVNMLGGCCGSTPEFVRALKSNLNPEA